MKCLLLVTDAGSGVLEKTTCPCLSVAIADTEYEHFGWWTMVDEGW